MNQKVKFGKNVVFDLPKYLKKINPKKILLVIGKKSFLKSGAKDKIEPLLNNFEYYKFYNETDYDNINNIIEGVEFIKKNKFDLIIGVGGGGVLDKSKIINILSSSSDSNLKKTIISGTFKKSKIPLVAIPTTAGTGSESTKFATLYIDKIKYSIEDDSIIPKIAIIDPTLIKSNSKYTMLSSGLDALSQSIESYWSVNSNIESKKYAKKAMCGIWEILPKIALGIVTQDDIDNLSYYSNLSGKAINISKTTACHAISYYLTSNYNIAHGHAVMLTLGNIFKLNLETDFNNLNDERGLKYCISNLKSICEMLKINSDNVSEIFSNYLKDLGLYTKLSQFGIPNEDLKNIVNSINVVRLKNNPRSLSNNDILNILKKIYK
tara:strand:+ start:1133 stop:2269 length:1137 start_codon:yes stop_codon:yes gene_type:complete